MLDAVHVPEILLPAKKENFHQWAVVACDQFTSEPDYWDEVERIVADAPSAFRLIYPEAALLSGEVDRAPAIHQAMRAYLASGVFGAPQKGFVLVERVTASGVRLGLLMLIDLHAYDHQSGAKSLIRPTEGTVLSRIPPRVRIRKNAPLELPHAMLLADDPQRHLVEPLYQKKQSLRLLYDFELMQNGGHLRGWLVEKPDDIASVYRALGALRSLSGEDPILFAVGDGNHSLATAKQCYLEAPNEQNRYALVEVVNLHQESIQFEPIHRLLHGVDECSLRSAAEGCGVSIDDGDVLSISPFLDQWLPEGASVDYIHGDETLSRLSAREGYVGIKLKGIAKDALFPFLSGGHVLPRKAFSMGLAQDKRYYMECRKIMET